MGTRSTIAIKHGDRIKAIYCHWDGYLEHNGQVLHEHYQSSPKVNNLIALGDVSGLREEIGEKHDFGARYSEDDEAYTWTTFYGRDRGETGVEFRSFGSEEEWMDHYDHTGAEFYYLFDNGVWYVSAYRRKMEPLHEALANLEKEVAQ